MRTSGPEDLRRMEISVGRETLRMCDFLVLLGFSSSSDEDEEAEELWPERLPAIVVSEP